MVIAGRNVALGAIVAAVGGLVAVVVSPLTWATASFAGQSSNLNGFDSGTNAGKAAVVLGILALILVALWVQDVKVPAIGGQPAIPAGLVVVGALMIVMVALVYFTSTLSDDSLSHMADLAKQAGGSVSLGLAFFLEALAGVAIIVGGGLALMKKS